MRIELAVQDLFGSFESPQLDVASFAGADSLGYLALDPPEADVEAGQARFLVRATHIPRNVRRLRFRPDTTLPVEVAPVSAADGGLLDGWNISGPDAEGFFDLASTHPLEFGSFGPLFWLTVSEVSGTVPNIPLVFDGSIYSEGKAFAVEGPPALAVALTSTELNMREVWTQAYPPGQIHFAFDLRDGDHRPVVASAEEVQTGVRIYEQGLDTDGWEEIDYRETGVFVRTDENFETVFVLAFSNSMSQTRLADGTESIAFMRNEFSRDLNSLPAGHRVGVMEFHDGDREPRVLSDLTTDRIALNSAVSDFDLSPSESGSSRVWDSIEAAASLFTTIEENPQVAKSIVIFTDGRDTSSIVTRSGAVTIASENNIRIYTVQIGSSLLAAELSEMVAATGGAYYQASRMEDADSQVPLLVDDLRAKQYRISYVTLRRQGDYRVRVETAVQGLLGEFESQPMDVASFGGPNSQVYLVYDPIELDLDASRLRLLVRALHTPRNLSRLRLQLGTTLAVDLELVSEEEGGILGGWEVSGPDVRGFYDVASAVPLEFGNSGPLLWITVSGVSVTTQDIPVEFDESIYPEGRSIVFTPLISLKPDAPTGP